MSRRGSTGTAHKHVRARRDGRRFRLGRVALAGALGACLLVAMPSFATAALPNPLPTPGPTPPGYRLGDYADGQARSVLPPGENGLVNTLQAAEFEATGTRPPNSDDQLGQYANLLYGSPSLTDGNLGTY
ncbi:MAG TPA: hypothetical protein VLR26_10830 [Frankiaceae bacterium]|nr:hypothetical protein [Frankiaceae bacterium]